jgi:3-hydroxyisobutyrate dehydrogenase
VNSVPSTERVVGLIGIGAMGEPMARRLAGAGFRVLAHDLDRARLSALAAEVEGVEPVGVDGLRPAPIVICMLPSSAAVRDTVGRLRDQLMPGALIVDMGSSDPRSTAELAGAASAAGIGLVDAPVSGGVARAKTGQLTIMFGGTAEQLERCRPVLEALGDNVFHVGKVGAGHAIKALNNLLSATALAAASEAIEVGRRYGLDPNTMLDVINHSTGRSHATETKMAQFVLSGTYASGFALRLMVKDVATAIDLANSLDVECRIGQACLDLWREAATRLPEDADQTQVALLAAGPGQTSVERNR